MAAHFTTSGHAAPDATLPEYALRATGAMRLVLVINLSSFVDPASADSFRHVRGSEPFAAALRTLHPQAPFGIDDAAAQVEQDGYALRIFRSRLRYNHFFPTYKIGWDDTMRARFAEMGYTDISRWQRWTPRLRLSRNGLAVVTLEQPFEDAPLMSCTEQVLELPAYGRHPAAQDQWSLGMTILRVFLDAIDRQIVLRIHDREQVIRFSASASSDQTLRLDRYVIYTIRRFVRDDQQIMPDQLKRDYAQTLASFMEGALVECDGVRRYPVYSAEQARALVASDSSSWDEELCLFTAESALIHCPLVDRGLAYVGGPLGLNAHAYGAYWAGIVRGIEHLVAFRSESQQAERRTTSLLSRIPTLTRKINDGHLVAEDLALIDQLAAGLSDIFDSLPEQRSMAVSSTAFRADYVRRKFDLLLDELDVEKTLQLVNTNVEQLDFFLSYYNGMRLQWQAQRTNSLALMLTVVVLFMAVSSFLADTFNVVDRLASENQRGWSILAWAISGVMGLLLLWAMIVMMRRLFQWRMKK